MFVRGQEILVDGVVGVPLDGQGPRRSLAAEDASVVGETRADGTLITATVPDVDAPREEAGLLGF